MAKAEIEDALEAIDFQIREFDFHGSYDMFSAQEVDALRKTKRILQIDLRNVEENEK